MVSVDTHSLRTAADHADELAARIAADAGTARSVEALLNTVDAYAPESLAGQARHIADALCDTEGGVADQGRRLRRTAAIYEYVELAARAAAAGGGLEKEALVEQMRRLRCEYPDIPLQVGAAAVDASEQWSGEILRQALFAGWMLGPLGAVGAAGMWFTATSAVRQVDRGVVPMGARLTAGSDTAAQVRRVERAPTTAVGTLAQATRRIPQHAAVRVEKYTMPGGRREFAVYIAGTGAGSAFDGQSNVQLYSGQTSASYEAVRDALRQAGARPGDVLHEFGHSQGGMIAARMALEGEYDVQTLVTLGSPVQAEVPASILSVELRHDDDIVSALAGGGSPAGVGSSESIVVTRTADPMPSVTDAALVSHGIDAYATTAGLVDASDDPRVGAVRAVFAHLENATSVVATEYTAERG